jgi:hypothetical protein
MIDELRIYTLRAGAMPAYLKLAEEVAVPIRGDRHGRLLGFWAGEIGAANSVFNLWQHDDLNRRQEVRAELERLEAWRRDYLAAVRPLMQQQVIRFLQAVVPAAPPAIIGNLYEVRLVRTRVGEAQAVAARLADHHPSVGVTVGVWTTLAGQLNEVVQILAYADPAARLGRSLHRPDEPLLGPDVEAIESSLVLPAAHSPMR